MLSGALAGFFVLIGALWAWYALQRLWQEALAHDAGAGLDAAEALGLVVAPSGLRARLVAAGTVGGQRIEVHWRGGARPAHTVVMANGRSTRAPLAVDAEALHQALAAAGVEPSSTV